MTFKLGLKRGGDIVRKRGEQITTEQTTWRKVEGPEGGIYSCRAHSEERKADTQAGTWRAICTLK